MKASYEYPAKQFVRGLSKDDNSVGANMDKIQVVLCFSNSSGIKSDNVKLISDEALQKRSSVDYHPSSGTPRTT